jgi:serine/threonine protein kinase
MYLAPGKWLGPYEILSPIGAGGMGEVYRARDSRLGRDVALKICSHEFDERFGREARAVAALNHPNVCTLYDVGPDYLVMELVDGSAPKGPLPLDEAIRVANQIAAALAAAHEIGLVHRDLKPANVKVTESGLVKVLDFGLAKRVATSSDDISSATRGLTESGVIVGTPAYMAPEQIRGKEVDRRADVWAFGVLLYELLTGRHPFRRDSVQATLAAVLTEEPDCQGLPARVQRVIRECLRKDPQERLSSIADWRFLLEDREQSIRPAAVPRNRMPWIIAAVAVLVAAVALWAPWHRDPDAQIGAPLVRIDADLGTGVSLFTENGPALALSRDGSKVAFSSRGGDGSVRLYWRRLDQTNAIPLPGTESGFLPFFSPNGEQLAFFAEGSQKDRAIHGKCHGSRQCSESGWRKLE